MPIIDILLLIYYIGIYFASLFYWILCPLAANFNDGLNLP